ncbi:hypothetical protein [Aeromicrobium sp. 50.2.37]|uniref:DUF6907 domain-containing protein n=1 Tax=Aeromicrobium sp. 50.2.37 TaxID=2969305 RepID=UPI00214FE599|nr:hypothetical protein [Aeromicrobium sp. 50.2.37]MCR4513998.1 hypothetical protein [Aeromicrobium sp. 50.2.37]
MDGDHTRPHWLHEPCPHWCASTHREDDAPEDRHHDSAPTYVPVVIGVREPGGARPRTQITDLLVVRTRRCGEPEEWVFVGEPDQDRQYLALAPDSARRVAAALVDQLDPATSAPPDATHRSVDR